MKHRRHFEKFESMERLGDLVKEYLILGTDKQDAEKQRDLWLSQNPALKVLRMHPVKLEPPTWLTRIAMNAALMKLRKSRLSRESSLEQHEETMKFRPEVRVKDSSLNPEDRYAESEREAILNNAIAALRPTIRRALEIYKLEECSVRETAEALGISVPAAKGRLFHARSELRKSPQLQFVVQSHWSKSRSRAHAAG